LNVPLDVLPGEQLRRTQCGYRNEFAGCTLVDQESGFRGGFRLDVCDSCYRVSPESEAAKRIRWEGILARDEGIIRKGFHRHEPTVIKEVLLRRPHEAADLIASLLPHISEECARQLAELYEDEAVRKMIVAAWFSIDRDTVPLAACTPCLRNKIVSVLGQHALSLSAHLAGEPKAPTFVVKPVAEPTWSAVIAYLNEGINLELTVTSVLAAERLPREVILVDDGSKERDADRCRALVEKMGVHFHHIIHDVRMGSGPSKHEGALASTSDLTVVLDSHMRVPWDFYNDMRTAYHNAPTSVHWAVSTGFDRTSWRGNFTRMRYRDDLGHWAGEWCDPPSPSLGPSYRTPCPYGGCYIIPREIMLRLGGYAPLLNGYGCEEEWLAFRAWISGCEIRCVRDLVVPHQYRRKIDRTDIKGTQPLTFRDLLYNRHIILSCIFEDESIYGRYYEKRLAKLAGNHYGDIVDEAAASVQAFRKFLKVVRRRTDSEIMTIMGMKHPNATNNTRLVPEVACAEPA